MTATKAGCWKNENAPSPIFGEGVLPFNLPFAQKTKLFVNVINFEYILVNYLNITENIQKDEL